ncbi:MAG TPA: hypothetical protein VFZ38_17850 [Vicinamibacterales bacterium]
MISSSNLRLKSMTVLKWSAQDLIAQIAKYQRQGRNAEATRLERWRAMTLREIERREKAGITA